MKKRDLTVITGSMFSGKTSKLINLYEADDSKEKIVIKHSLDDLRGGEGMLSTHDGIKLKDCQSTNSLTYLTPMLEQKESIYIDEGQFFDSIEMTRLMGLCFRNGIKLTVSGLLRDRRNRHFITMKKLLLECSNSIMLVAKCRCGNPATETRLEKKEAETNSINLVGGADMYQPSCLECWK